MTEPVSNRLKSAAAAIGFLVVGMGALGSQDVPMKNLSAEYSVVQLLFTRSVFALLIFQIVLWCIRHRTPLDTERLGWHVLRGFVLCLALGCYYVALSALTLLDAIAIFFTGPLFAAALSALILKERISIRRWAGIAAGFTGALIMIRPGGEGVVQAASLFALAAAVLYAASIVMTRFLGATESAVSTAYLTMVMYIGVTGVGLAIVDALLGRQVAFESVSLLRPLGVFDFEQLSMLCFSGAMVCVGFFCLAHAYRLAEVSILASWEYTALLWAGLWGYVFLDEVPTPWALLGAAVIVGSGIYVTRRSV